MNHLKKTILTLLGFFFLCVPTMLGAELKVKVLRSPTDLPEPFCDSAREGDFLITDGSFEMLIGGSSRPMKNILNYSEADAMGSILAFVPTGKKLKSLVNIGSPEIKIGDRYKVLTYSSVQAKKDVSAGAVIIECLALYDGPGQEKLRIRTTYRLLPGQGKVDIDSTLINTGTSVLKNLDFSLSFNANHRYYFSPYLKKAHPAQYFRVYQKTGHGVGWQDPNPVPADREGRTAGTLSPSQPYKIKYALWTDNQSERILQRIFNSLQIKTWPVTLELVDARTTLREVVVREVSSSSVFFRAFLPPFRALLIPLPEGAYSVTANFFPGVREETLLVREKGINSCKLQSPPLAGVKVSVVTKKGEFVPGKITFIGIGSTKDPYFGPENPVITGRSWETFKNSRYARAEGTEVSLAAGTYLVQASRGPEYTVDKKVIELLEAQNQDITLQIDRAFETKNLLSLDPHLHTQNSDSAVRIPERLRSIVAEGIEVAVATDHNFITDYIPELKKNGLGKYLAVIPGSEVTPPNDFIHFCVYPQRIKAEEDNRGAISPMAEEPVTLFKESRKANPGAILQLNHPRAGDLGYFSNFNLDKKTAATASKNFDTSFDVCEVMNGPVFMGDNQQAVEDWFHLLRRGYYFPIVGSSDSHSADAAEPGYARTYVFYTGAKADRLNLPAVIEAVKKGRSFVSTGPMVEFKVNKKYVSGDLATARKGKVALSIKILSAPWVTVEEARIIVNGERTVTLPIKTAEGETQKYEKRVRLVLDKDAFIALEVLGTKTLYPVVQQPSWDHLVESAAVPYALTNPVFVDVDGNGRFDPPLPEKVRILGDISKNQATENKK